MRIIGAVSLMSCVGYFVAMCILSPLGRERQMAMSSIAADPVSVALNLLLDGPFGAVGAGIALLATAATVLRIELCTAGFPTGLDMAIAATKLLRELGGSAEPCRHLMSCEGQRLIPD